MQHTVDVWTKIGFVIICFCKWKNEALYCGALPLQLFDGDARSLTGLTVIMPDQRVLPAWLRLLKHIRQ